VGHGPRGVGGRSLSAVCILIVVEAVGFGGATPF